MAWLVLLSLALLLGCGGDPTEAEAVGEATAAARQAVEPGRAAAVPQHSSRVRSPAKRAARGKVGIVRRVIRQARRAGLSDGQREAVDEVRRVLAATVHERAVSRRLAQALAAGVRAGEVDVELVRSRSALLGEVKVAQRGRQMEALESLHAILAPEQRSRVAAALSGRGPRGVAVSGPARHPGRAVRPEGRSRQLDLRGWGELGELLSRLDLTREQRGELRRASGHVELDLPSPPERRRWRERRRAARAALLESFASPRFDPGEYFRGPFERNRTRRLDNELLLLEAVLPVLTKPQRAALARMILDRAPRARS